MIAYTYYKHPQVIGPSTYRNYANFKLLNGNLIRLFHAVMAVERAFPPVGLVMALLQMTSC